MSCFNRQGEVKADDAKYTGTEPTWDDVSSLTDKEVTDRLSKGLKTNVVIRITDFCDTNDNEYVSVDLLLNRGGMALSLIYIDNDSTDNTDGYWMFLNNSYTYA